MTEASETPTSGSAGLVEEIAAYPFTGTNEELLAAFRERPWRFTHRIADRLTAAEAENARLREIVQWCQRRLEPGLQPYVDTMLASRGKSI